MSAHQGYAPETQKYQHKIELSELVPQKECPALSSSPSKERDKPTDKKIDMLTYVRKATTRQFADTISATETRKSGYQGSPRGGGRTFFPREMRAK